MTHRYDRTSDDVEAILASYRLPGGGSWRGLALRHAKAVGARLSDVCMPGRPPRMAARAKHAAWAELREFGYSWCEIARPWGADHTTVMDAVKRILANKEAA